MIFPFDKHQAHIVTIYTYIVKRLYIVTISSLLRESIYTKLLYVARVIGISNRIDNPHFYIFGFPLFNRAYESYSRQIRKSLTSPCLPVFISLEILEIPKFDVPINRDINPSSN